MNRLNLFEKTHQEAMLHINGFLTEPSDMQELVQWMLTTEINPYSYLPEKWAGAVTSSTSFEYLLNAIHHALYDDGDISFVTVNEEPRIVFAAPDDDNFRQKALNTQEQHSGKQYTIEVLNIHPKEFGPLCETHSIQNLKKHFAMDAAKWGAAFAATHYSTYACFNQAWITECAEAIQKWQKFYNPNT